MRLEEQNQKMESGRENSCNEIQMLGYVKVRLGATVLIRSWECVFQ